VALDRAKAPFLDRTSIESLFGVRRRQALKLVHTLGGYRVGNVLLAPREAVVDFLDATLHGKQYRAERIRRERVIDSIEEARREIHARKVTFKVPVSPPRRTLAELPEGVHLSPTELQVTFAGAQDLLEKLFALSRAMAADFARFEVLVGDEPARESH
jgi:hypothetical protein